MNNEKRGYGNFWLGFFLGGLVGAFIIFVLGTKKGKELAEKVIENAELYEEEFEQKVAKLQHRGKQLLQEAQEVKEKVVKDVEEGKKRISDTLVSRMDKALSEIEDIQKKGVEITSEVHHRYFKKNGKPLVS